MGQSREVTIAHCVNEPPHSKGPSNEILCIASTIIRDMVKLPEFRPSEV